MRVHVNLSTDMSIGLSFHKAAPPPVEVPAIEGACEHAWAPGESEGKHRMARSVKHRCLRIVQEGHDCGPGITHVTIPTDAMLPKTIADSERKMLFGASTVRAEGTPIACADLRVSLPMTTCSSQGLLPTAFPITNLERTVVVGATARDVWRGWVTLAQDQVVERVTEKIAELIVEALGIPGLDEVPDWLLPPGLQLIKEAVGAYVEICVSMIAYGLTGGEIPVHGDLDVPWGSATVDVDVRPGRGIEVVITHERDGGNVRQTANETGIHTEREAHPTDEDGPPPDAEARGWTREGGYRR